MIVLVLLPLMARAGTYTWTGTDPKTGKPTQSPVYSGGTAVTTGPNAKSTPYSGTGPYGASCGVGNPSSSIPTPSAMTANCSGKITATFTWQPASGQTATTDPPPASVVVEQDCTLQNQLNGSGTCTWATGLGQSGSGNVNLTQTAYLVVTNCGSSFQTSCSPSVLCTVPAGSVYSYGGGSVSYKAAAAPIVIQGWGTIPDSTGSGANVLVGQGIRAFLTALGSNTSVAFSSYNWGISGAVTGFATGSTPTSHGHVVNLNASDLQSASPHWYWTQGTASGTSATITCDAMASINGVNIGIVNATGHVNVVSPPHLWGHANTSVQIVGQGTSSVSLTTDMPWTLQVVTPPPFSTYYKNLGYYYITQLCSLNRDLGSTDPLGLDITVNTGGFVLDGEQIYSTIDIPGGTWPADGKQNTSGDTPTIGLDLKSAVTQHDAWQAFLMYMPPGPDSLAVPIHELDWKVDCDDHLLLGHGGDWSPNPPGTVVVTGDVSFDTSPANWPGWDDVYTGSGA